jgi:hypothetical protein
MHAKFLRERHNVLAALQSLHRLPAELVRIPSHSLLCHLQFPFPAQCAFSECLIFGVQSNLRDVSCVYLQFRNAPADGPSGVRIEFGPFFYATLRFRPPAWDIGFLALLPDEHSTNLGPIGSNSSSCEFRLIAEADRHRRAVSSVSTALRNSIWRDSIGIGRISVNGRSTGENESLPLSAERYRNNRTLSGKPCNCACARCRPASWFHG